MDVILLFDQYLLAKSISYDYITEHMTKWKLTLA